MVDLWSQIEARRDRWNVLRHPFYVRWTKGQLSREELADYSGQYRHVVEAVADLTAWGARAFPDWTELSRHAEEESSHVELWGQFVSAVGGDPHASPYPETERGLDGLSFSPTPLAGLAKLYAIERAQPEIARVKLAGLAGLYGLADGAATEYFRLHAAVDDTHADEVRARIDRSLTQVSVEPAVEAAELAYRSNWLVLDGVDAK